MSLPQPSGYTLSACLYESAKILVYRGVELATQAPVVLKMLKPESRTLKDAGRLRQEYELLQALEHPGVVRTRALLDRPDLLALVLDDIGGETLAARLQRGPMAPGAFFSIALQVTEALGYVHRQGVLHKDVNPNNIIVYPVTGHAQLIDFSIAARSAGQGQAAAASPGVLEGTVAYLSPEQTGRMDRAVDERSDLYSLGVTFFQMLTGQVPFVAADPLEMIHCHMAKRPPSPTQVSSQVPPVLSAIVLLLLAKNPEERYRNAEGLAADLHECQRQWESGQHITPFVLGRHDTGGRFAIPSKVYGRERELALLQAALARVSQGRAELLTVAGYSGIGKSAVVGEVRRSLPPGGGYFIAGKFEQLRRAIPYSALLQALQELVRQLLTESEERLAVWRHELQTALGNVGRLLTEVLPELEPILGPQPPVPPLAPAESKNRFLRMFQDFIQVFTGQGHPLVLFLDDMQWADSATLDLLTELLSNTHRGALLVIAAYRDNEVTPSHPCALTLAAIAKHGCTTTHISVGPLPLEAVLELVADTLGQPREQVRPLAALVHEKAQGLPLFINVFLTALHQQGLLAPGADGQWRWDSERIAGARLPDDLVDLVTARIERLSPAAQRVLQLAACLGNRFTLGALAQLYERSVAETAQDLAAAVQEGLVLPVRGLLAEPTARSDDSASPELGHRFLHDRIQQSVYAMLPEPSRIQLHHRIGQLLRARQTAVPDGEALFELVNQLNLAASLVTDTTERIELARLNLLAGQRAAAAAAYGPAAAYCAAGRAFLPAGAWASHYELAYALHLEGGEYEYLSNSVPAAERLFDSVEQAARTGLDKARVHGKKSLVYMRQSKLHESVHSSLSGLRQVGVELPATPSLAAVAVELLKAKRLFAGRTPQALLSQPGVTDPNIQVAIELMACLIDAAYFLNQNLFTIVALRMGILSAQYGNSEAAPQAYSIYGALLANALGQYAEGQRLGQLGMDLIARTANKRLSPKVYFCNGTLINPWNRPLRSGLDTLRKAYTSGLEFGDFTYSGYAVINLLTHLLAHGDELQQVHAEAEKYADFIDSTRYTEIRDIYTVLCQAMLCLRGLTRSATQFDTASYDEQSHAHAMTGRALRTPTYWYYYVKLMTLYVGEDYAGALAIARAADKDMGLVCLGHLQVAEHYYFYSLTLAAMAESGGVLGRQRALWLIRRNLLKLGKWARACPANFRHKQKLVEAELARLTRDDGAAIKLYDQALTAAREQGFTSDEAIAAELAARFYRARGLQTAASGYLTRAHRAYVSWGAARKVALMESRDHELRRPPSSGRGIGLTTTSTQGLPAASLDMPTVIKASQALSSEIVLDRLLARLMNVVIESAGATRGVLILKKEGGLELTAEATVEQGDAVALRSQALDASTELPVAVVHYVVRTQRNLVLNDPTKEGDFTADPYIARVRPRSVLGMPLLSQGQVAGALYLENNLVASAFTAQRLELLGVLAGQMAISIQNAYLYAGLQQALSHEQQAREAENETNRQLAALLEDLEQIIDSRTRELKEAQARVVKLEKEATEAQMAGGFAHEMRNALTGAKAFLGRALTADAGDPAAHSLCMDNSARLAELYRGVRPHLPPESLAEVTSLVRRVHDNEKMLDEVLRGIYRSIDRALKITRLIMDYSRLGQEMPGHEAVELPQLVSAILQESAEDLHSNRITHDVQIPPGAVLDADEEHLYSILKNLIVNARDAMVEKEETATRHLGVAVAPGQPSGLVIEISDTGVGIPAEIRSRIFEPFFSTKPQTGTGLGLGVVQKLASLYGGLIDIASEPGQGTTFRLHFPGTRARVIQSTAPAAEAEQK